MCVCRAIPSSLNSAPSLAFSDKQRCASNRIPAEEDEGNYALPPAPPVMSKTSDANYRAACDALCLLDTNLPGFDVPYERRAG